jgi:paspaline synthase
MDWFIGAIPPPEYQAVAWFANVATIIETIGWAINYGDSIHRSVKDRTYGMAIFPMCLNLSWEIVYTLVYPCNDTYQWIMIVTWLLLNPGIMLCAIRYAPNEWQHAPLVRGNIPLIFALTMVACILGQLAAAATLGPGVAATVVACFCYLLLTVGSLCQLIIRGSSRGTSYTMW